MVTAHAHFGLKMKFDDTHQQALNTAISEITETYPDVIAIYLFGSFATPFENKNSDVDLAILRDRETNTIELWELAQKIACKIDRDVDLIDLQKASTVFRYQIFTTGHPIYCQDERSLSWFENLVISMYLRFQEERKEILENYSRDQKNYG